MLIISDRHSQLHAWLVAASAGKAMQQLSTDIQHIVVSSPDSNEANDNIVSLQGDALLALQHLGISQKDLFVKADAAPWLADSYTHWNGANHQALAGLARSGVNFNNVEFKHYFSRAFRHENNPNRASFDQFSLNTLCASKGVFVHPSSDPRSIFSSLEYGLSMDGRKMAALLEDIALEYGVEKVELSDVQLDSILSAQQEQLKIDCHLTTEHQHQANIPLPVSKLISVKQTKQTQANRLCNEMEAQDEGVSITQSSAVSALTKTFGFDSDCENSPPNTAPYWRHESNQITIGQSVASQLAVDSGVDLTISILNLLWPLVLGGQQNTPTCANYFNRRAAQLFAYFCDRVSLPFVLAKRKDTAFWQHISQFQPSEQLAHLIAMFESSGNLPSYENYPNPMHEIENVLMAFECIPQNCDPLSLHLNDEQLLSTMQKLHDQLHSAVNQIPGV